MGRSFPKTFGRGSCPVSAACGRAADRLNPLHTAADGLSHVARELDAEADALRDQARHLRRQADTLESWDPRSP